jgi:hypothetical protein
MTRNASDARQRSLMRVVIGTCQNFLLKDRRFQEQSSPYRGPPSFLGLRVTSGIDEALATPS